MYRPRHIHLSLLSALAALALLVGCRGSPSRAEALLALERGGAAGDTALVFERVWQDGPPWFSCAEVLAKLDGPADSAVVRDQMRNWRPLVLSGWVVLRDTAYGAVSDPGWCAAKRTAEADRPERGWRRIEGEAFPSGAARRGWSVPIGRRRVGVVSDPRRLGRDTATVEYVVTIAANVNGVALRADRDSLFRRATLTRVDGRWRLLETAPYAATRVGGTTTSDRSMARKNMSCRPSSHLTESRPGGVAGSGIIKEATCARLASH